MNVRHACLLRAISMGGPDDLSRRPRALDALSHLSSWLRRGASATTTTTNDDGASFDPPEAFICERNSESDRFAILRPRAFSVLPSTNLSPQRRRFSCSLALPSCRDRAIYLLRLPLAAYIIETYFGEFSLRKKRTRVASRDVTEL